MSFSIRCCLVCHRERGCCRALGLALVGAIALCGAVVACLPLAAFGADPSFNRDVRPILAKHCFACHGRDADNREADLRLDIREHAAAALSPEDPEQSELLSRIESADPEQRMPPLGTGAALTKEEVETLRAWIAAGAAYQRHWSYEPPVAAEPPAVNAKNWPLSPIDAFVLGRLERAGLRPAPDADRALWLRRVTLDLTGLPPTLDELDAFLADKSKTAHEAVVDRLLKSPAFGERWARMWLDLARYADTKGYEKDRHRDIWRYRDWVIASLNQDMPYDQFTREQLAGDLLPDRTEDQLLATAFHRNTMTNEEGGTDNEEFRVAAVKDRVDTTVQVWMGLTMGCAKCHSHKYDPIELKDYYSFYAFFNQTQDADAESPLWPMPTKDLAEQIERQRQAVAQLADQAKSEDDDEAAKKQLAQAEAELKRLRDSAPKIPVMLELAPNKRRTTRMHNRGNFLDPGETVESGVLSVFGELADDAPQSRLGVAQWLMQPDNPLTARVMVNRLWARLFGVGIVATEEDFGTQGAAPSHPQLLDWLAVAFRDDGWSLKRMLRRIVLSRTYRQASASGHLTPSQRDVDPQNRLLWRGPRFRLSAEMVRDQALAASGLLSRTIGGPSVMPPQPSGIWKSTYNGQSWVNAEGPNRYRRALYTYLKRTSPYPSLTTFDAGTGEVCQLRRVRTNTPLQALVTLNDPAYLEAAGALSQRMAAIDGPLEQKLAYGFRCVLSRRPQPREVKRLSQLYNTIGDDLADPAQLIRDAGLSPTATEPSQWKRDAAMIAVANVLLNLDEALMKP